MAKLVVHADPVTLIGLIFLGFLAAGFICFSLTAQSCNDAPADATLTGL